MKTILSCFMTVLTVSICLGASTHAPNKNDTSTPQTSPVTTPSVTTPSTAPTTTLSPEALCLSKSNGSCDDCVGQKSAECVYCSGTKKCLLKKHVIPTDECAGLADAKWAVCWLNYEALIIACGVIGGILILGLTICICCCCCCRGNKKASFAKEDAKYERQKAERKAKADERKAERKAKTDEIRRKYGLIKDDNPYTRFDEN